MNYFIWWYRFHRYPPRQSFARSVSRSKNLQLGYYRAGHSITDSKNYKPALRKGRNMQPHSSIVMYDSR